MRLLLIIAGLALTIAAGPALAQSTVYNVVKDFSTVSNPNGVWSYSVYDDDGTYLLPDTTSALKGIPDWTAWVVRRSSAHTAEVARNDTHKTIRHDSIVAPTNELMLNPGSNMGAYVVFSAPAHGLYRIDAEFQAISKNVVADRVVLNEKSRNLVYASLSKFGQTVGYHGYITLRPKQQIYAEVYSTNDTSSPNAYATGLFLKIKGPIEKNE